MGALRSYDYAPWVVANLTLSEPPFLHHGAPLCWDNVLYHSASLGYVVATHQSLESRPGPTVLTWYLPLTGEPAPAARKRLLATPRESWAAAALADLATMDGEWQNAAARQPIHMRVHGSGLPLGVGEDGAIGPIPEFAMRCHERQGRRLHAGAK